MDKYHALSIAYNALEDKTNDLIKSIEMTTGLDFNTALKNSAVTQREKTFIDIVQKNQQALEILNSMIDNYLNL